MENYSFIKQLENKKAEFYKTQLLWLLEIYPSTVINTSELKKYTFKLKKYINMDFIKEKAK